MSGNGAFAKANGILSVEEAMIAAAKAGRRARGLLEPAPPGSERYASHRLDDAARLAQVAAGLGVYAEALVKVRGT